MATRGQIGIKYKDGSITSVYSHWDNYITDGNGEILYNNYNNIAKVNNLISLGNISSLGKNIESTKFYDRDMNRKGEEARKFRNFDDWQKWSSYGFVDYNYLYDAADGEWYVWEGYNDRLQGRPLSFALTEKLAKGGKIINNKHMSEHEHFNRGGRQGYNDRLDESLAMRRGRKRQNFKDRRDESKGAERSRLRRAYSSVGTMDRFDSPYRLARGGDSSELSREMLRSYDVRSPYGTYNKGGRPKKHMKAQGGDVYTGSHLSSAGDTKFTFKGESNGEVYTGRDVSMMAARGKSLKKRKSQRAQGGDVYSGSNLSKAGDSKFTFKGGKQSDVYTGRDVNMMAAKGKLVPSLHPTHKEVLQLMSLPEVEAQEYIIGQKDLIIGQLKDKMQDIHEFAELALQGDNFALEQIEAISDHARFNQGGEVYTGSNLSNAGDTQFTFKGQPQTDTYTGKDISMMAAQGGEAYTGSSLSDAGNSDFSFTGQSGSNETYTGKDISMMAARGKSLKKVKKASKGGETGIGMF